MYADGREGGIEGLRDLDSDDTPFGDAGEEEARCAGERRRACATCRAQLMEIRDIRNRD